MLFHCIEKTAMKLSKKMQGRYVLTGSSTPIIKGELRSGRIGRVKMRTMSLYEAGISSGKVSLGDMFAGAFKPCATGDVKLDDLIACVIKGGWPGAQSLSAAEAMQISADYLRNVPDDMERMDGKRRDYRKVYALLRALGRAESNMTPKKKLKRDVEEYADNDS